LFVKENTQIKYTHLNTEVLVRIYDTAF